MARKPDDLDASATEARAWRIARAAAVSTFGSWVAFWSVMLSSKHYDVWKDRAGLLMASDTVVGLVPLLPLLQLGLLAVLRRRGSWWKALVPISVGIALFLLVRVGWLAIGLKRMGAF